MTIEIEKVVTLSEDDRQNLRHLRYQKEEAERKLQQFEANLIQGFKPPSPAYGPFDRYNSMKSEITENHIVFYT